MVLPLDAFMPNSVTFFDLDGSATPSTTVVAQTHQILKNNYSPTDRRALFGTVRHNFGQFVLAGASEWRFFRMVQLMHLCHP